MKKFEEIIVTKEDGEVVAVISGNEIIELEGYRVDLRGKGGKEEYKPIDARQLSVNDFTIAEDGEILDDPLAVEKILNMNDRLAR